MSEFHHAVLDGIELGIVTTDPAGVVTFVNRTARKLLRVSTRSGGDVRELLGLQSSPADLASTNKKVSYMLAVPGGDELDLSLSVRSAAKEGYFFVFRDVREEKRTTAERERFGHLAAIGTMVAGFAHEVRNPVAALKSLAESLAEDLADMDVAMPHVSRMLEVLDRIERLVRTSLQFGRPASPRRARHRPWTVLAAAVGELAPRTRALQGEIRLEMEPDLPDVFIDDSQIIQVLIILLDNALDAAGSPRRVGVRVKSGNKKVRFEVYDEGPGIPAEILGRIFDPFFTTKSAGTGLGLSIAQHIVTENGGTIEVSSLRGGPTTFAVAVPLS
jgi:signal transduction histidine kinase